MIHVRPDRLQEDFAAVSRRHYEAGQAHVLVKAAATPELSYDLAGRLYLTSGGWGLLSVPNALARGAFDALHEVGVELPAYEGRFNAHISVFRPEEIEQLGGADKLSEKGHSFSYTLGPVRAVQPASWEGVSRVWYIEVNSPELERLRKSYGLPALPNEGKHRFHITFAIRKKGVLRENEVSKAAAASDPVARAGKLLASWDGYDGPSLYVHPAEKKVWLCVGDWHDDADVKAWSADVEAEFPDYDFTCESEANPVIVHAGGSKDGWTRVKEATIQTAAELPGDQEAPADVYLIEGNPAVQPEDADKYNAFYNEILDHIRSRGWTAERFPSEDFKEPPGGRAWLGHSRGGGMLWKAPPGVETLRLDDYEPAETRQAQEEAYRTLFARLGVNRIRDVPVEDRPQPGPEHHTYSDAHRAAVDTLLNRLRPADKEASADVEIKPSPIDGLGLFAKRAFAPGEVVVSRALVKYAGVFNLTRYEESDPARFTNHADDPAIRLRKEADGSVSFVARRPIAPGDEITADYRRVGSSLGPGFYFTYKDVPYLGESTSGAPPYTALAPAHEKAAMVDQYGGMLGSLQYLLLNPFIQQWAAQHGLVYAPGQGNIVDRMDAMRHITQRWQATSQAGQADRPSYERLLTGLANMAGASPDTNPQVQRAIATAAGDIGTIAPYIRVFAPDLWERMHGWRGSSASLADRLYTAGRATRDPTTGKKGPGGDLADRTRQIFDRLYGPQASPATTAGFSAAHLGDLYGTAHARGLMSSPTPMSPTQEADRLADLSRPTAAVRDLMASMPQPQKQGSTKAAMVGTAYDGDRRYDVCPTCHKELKPNDVYTDAKKWSWCRRCFRKGKGLLKKGLDAAGHVDLLEKLTQGQLPNLDPRQVSRQVRSLESLSDTTPGGVQRLLTLIGHGGDVAQAAGLPRLLATQTAPGAAAYGQAWGQLAGRQGFNGLTMDEAIDLDQRLRSSAAASPLANLMGATAALADAGLLQPGTPGAELAEAIQAGQTTTASGVNIGRMTAPQWVEMMGRSGVSTGAAWEQYRAREANQEYVYRHNLADVVRHAQREVEVEPVMRNFLAQGMIPALARAGITGPEQVQLLRPLSASVSEILGGLPHAALLGPRSGMVQAVAGQLAQRHPDLAQRLGPDGLAEMAHTSLSNVDQTVRSDPRFQPYRNMVGLLTAHRPDILRSGMAMQQDADFEGGLREQYAHVGQPDWVQRISDTVQTAGPETPWTNMLAQGFGAVPQRQMATPPDVAKLPPQLAAVADPIGQSRQKRLEQVVPRVPEPQLPLQGGG